MEITNSIKKWINRLKKQTENTNKKTIFPILLFVFCLITPTLGAIGYVFHSDYIKKADVFSVTLYDNDNNELATASGTPDRMFANSLVNIFYSLTTGMKQTDRIPGDPEADPHIRAVTELNGARTELNCYFSFIENGGYCIDTNGKVYTIAAKDNEKFLNSEYSESFYANAKPPSLLTNTNEPILPTTATWRYQNYEEKYREAKTVAVAAETRSYETTGAVGLHFTKEPDSCTVQVYEQNDLLYEGPYSHLSYLTVDVGSELSVKAQAVWEESADQTAYGELIYDFRIRVQNQSTFTLSSDTVTAGAFTVLSCTNITDPSKVIFSSEIDGLNPIFHRDGSYVRAILAFSEETAPGSYRFKVSYGAAAKDFTVEVTPAAERAEYEAPSLNLSNSTAITKKAGIEWTFLLNSLAAGKDTSVYFRGNFQTPTDSGFRAGYTHGGAVMWGKSLDQFFTALGSEFLTDDPSGAAVPALNHGVVIQAGQCDLLGTYVIVDHGCGLRTWYGHLSNLYVDVGDVVRKGDNLGRTGTGGLATGNGFVLLCSVYDTLIDPATLLGKAVSFDQPSE